MVPADPVAGATIANANATVKKKGQSARSWIVIDCGGEGTILDVDKYAIMHRVHIHARDLRILDPLLSYPSTILGRDKAIVLNLEVTHTHTFFFSLFVFLNDLRLIGFWFQFCVFSISRQLSLLKRFVTLSLFPYFSRWRLELFVL